MKVVVWNNPVENRYLIIDSIQNNIRNSLLKDPLMFIKQPEISIGRPFTETDIYIKTDDIEILIKLTDSPGLFTMQQIIIISSIFDIKKSNCKRSFPIFVNRHNKILYKRSTDGKIVSDKDIQNSKVLTILYNLQIIKITEIDDK